MSPGLGSDLHPAQHARNLSRALLCAQCLDLHFGHGACEPCYLEVGIALYGHLR